VSVAVGIVDLGHDGALRTRLVIAPEHTDRIEGITKDTGTRQQQHARCFDPVIRQQTSDVQVIVTPDSST
jgi:hypothetical protein